MLGDFLELSLTTVDILVSIEFYRKLGFSEAPAGSSWKHPYTVMTDGRLYLGLHKREAVSPAMSFVLPELRKRMEDFEALGVEFDVCNIELHHFNELGFLDTDGQRVTLLEARTYSPVHDAHLPPTVCGYFQRYRLCVRSLALSARFWEAMGFIMGDVVEKPEPHVEASWGGINLEFRQSARPFAPTLVFSNPNLDAASAVLEMRGLTQQTDMEGLRLTTPEGLTLLLLPEEG
jgi:hypothetical protein